MLCPYCVDLKEAFAGQLAAVGMTDQEPEELTPEHEAQHKRSCIKLAEILIHLEETRPLLILVGNPLPLESLNKAIAIMQGIRAVALKHGTWPEESNAQT